MESLVYSTPNQFVDWGRTEPAALKEPRAFGGVKTQRCLGVKESMCPPLTI